MILAPQITFRNMEPVPELEGAVLKEIATLERFFNRIVSCRIAIEGPKAQRYGGLYNVRIDLGVPNEELVVKHTPTLHGTLKSEEVQHKTKQAEPRREHRDARRAIHDAFQEMRRRLQDYTRRSRGQTKQHELDGRAKVMNLDLKNDCGWLETRDGRRIYFHRHSVLHNHFNELRVGSDVTFAEEPGEKGPQASTVKLVHPSKQAREAARTNVV